MGSGLRPAARVSAAGWSASYGQVALLIVGALIAWRDSADTFVGPSIDDAVTAFRAEQRIMNDRYEMLLTVSDGG